jgi:hypothetical protein
VTPLVASVNRMCRLPGVRPLNAVSASGCPPASNSTTPGAAGVAGEEPAAFGDLAEAVPACDADAIQR